MGLVADAKRRKLEELAERRSSAPAPAPVQARAPATPEVASVDPGLTATTGAFVNEQLQAAARHVDVAAALLTSALRAQGNQNLGEYADPDDRCGNLSRGGNELTLLGTLKHVATQLGNDVAARKRSR